MSFVLSRTALSFLTLLACQRSASRAPVLLQDAAKELGMTPSRLQPVAVRLRAAGLIASRRGRGGGYFLPQPLERMSLWDVVHAVEPPSALHFGLPFGRRHRPVDPSTPYAVVDELFRSLSQSLTQHMRQMALHPASNGPK